MTADATSDRNGANAAPRFGRVLLKLSGEDLMGSLSYGQDPERVAAVARALRDVRGLGVQLAVVVGGGNIYRGLAASKHGMDRATGDYAGMLGTVLNALALQDALEQLGVFTRVQSALTIEEIAEPYIRRRAIRHLEKGRVVIFAGGTGNPFFTTDTAAALRACEIGAEAILMGKNGVDGVYDDDPRVSPNAHLLSQITHREVIDRGLRVMDVAAVSLCLEEDMPIYVFNGNDEANIQRVVRGERLGTVIATGRHAAARTAPAEPAGAADSDD
jgi:uridylate kinase